MKTWIKGSLLVLGAFALCWGGAIAYWSATHREPSASDLAVWMLAVPLALLALLLVGRKLLSMRAAAAAAPASAAAAASDAPATPAGPGPALAVLAAAVRTPHGAAPEELAAAVDDGKARADLDPELVDDEGYPIMSARVADAGEASLREEIEEWMAAHAPGEVGFSDEQWRALGMATGVATELAYQAAAHPHAAPGADPAAGTPAAGSPAAGMPPAPLLRILLLLGQSWSEPQRAAAGDWLRHLAIDAGWPEARIAVGAPAATRTAEKADANTDRNAASAAVSAALTMLTANAHAAKEPLLALVLAFDSQIGEASVDRLAARGQLFGTRRPHGSIPGEGAAGLLLADPGTAQLMGAEAPLIHALSAARDGCADAAKRPDAAALRALAAHAATQGAIEASSVAMLVADTDHRTSRIMELMALAGESLPHLDAASDVKASGTACGACGAVPALAALALAVHHARDLAKPVLCVSNEDSHHRGAVLVRPAALQS